MRQPLRIRMRAGTSLGSVLLLLTFLVPAHAQQDRPGSISPSLIKEDLYSASFVSLDEGWVVGTFGGIYHTADGGESWTKQSSGTLVPLFSVSFADAQHGWAVGKTGTILRTVDGGRTWAQYASPEGKHLFSVDAVSPQVAWAVGDWGKIAMTTDGGITWQDRSLTDDVILYAIDFADERHGWIVGEVGHLFFTADGGQTWTQQRTATRKSLFGVHVADRDHAWAVGLDGEIWQFAGGGWEQISSGVTTALYDVQMDEQNGWVVGDNGTAIITEDGGTSWRNVNIPDDLRLFWMHSISLTAADDTARGLIAGANGLLLWIRNGQIATN